MKVSLNGKEIQAEKNLHKLLETENFHLKKGIAVAVNNTVVPRSGWESFVLSENDRILVIQASQGG